jgi:hypothetical protein
MVDRFSIDRGPAGESFFGSFTVKDKNGKVLLDVDFNGINVDDAKSQLLKLAFLMEAKKEEAAAWHRKQELEYLRFQKAAKPWENDL